MNLQERARLATACLPDAPYRVMLTTLLHEMLDRIEDDEALMLQALATLRWNCFGECRTEGYEGTTLAANTAGVLRKRLEKT
jgi:hypothetical protein